MRMLGAFTQQNVPTEIDDITGIKKWSNFCYLSKTNTRKTGCLFLCGPAGARTLHLRRAKAALYQMSYWPDRPTSLVRDHYTAWHFGLSILREIDFHRVARYDSPTPGW